ncbi:MAG: nitroreductase family deazaflavin-dependent oxidoreductase [Acidimicrobiia bacterium]
MMIIPRDVPGPIWRRILGFPVLLYRLGLGFLISRSVLLLTTTGRKTGRPRVTGVGYIRDPATGRLFLTAGWSGESHWFRNVMSNPRVQVQLGRQSFEGIATPATEDVAMKIIAEYTRRNPFAPRIWQRWTKEPFDGSRHALRAVLKHFPVLELHRSTLGCDCPHRARTGLLPRPGPTRSRPS